MTAPAWGTRDPLPVTDAIAGGRSFRTALRIVAQAEGGDVDHPKDPGGKTRWGVTQATYHAYLQRQRRPLQDVSRMDAHQAAAIYHEMYWLAGFCHTMPHPAGIAHFDALVQHGSGSRTKVGANHLLQRALQLQADGIIGPRTREAIMAAGSDLVHALLWERCMHYWSISLSRADLWVSFGRGWQSRMRHLHQAIMAELPA